MNLLLELLALAGLILVNAFFVGAEYGLVTSRRTRIMELEHEGNRRARAVLRITSDPPRFISAMQLGVTISSLAIGALGEQVLAHKFDAVMASALAVLLALLMLLSSSAEQGEIEHEEQEMLYKVFDFADKEVSDVMVPRPEVVAISIELPPDEALQAVLTSPYTRYPVYRGSLDEIVGTLHVRDLIEAMYERGIASVSVDDLVRPAYMVP